MSSAQVPCFGIALNLEQSSLIMAALAERPFRTVFALIGRLNVWANDAFADDAAMRAQQLPFALCNAELTLVLQALEELPHRRVHTLIGSLQCQIARMRQDATHE